MTVMDDRESRCNWTPRQGRFPPGWSLVASAGFHALVAVIVLLFLIFGIAQLPEEPVLRVTVLNEGPGAAGAAGGAEGVSKTPASATSAAAAAASAPATTRTETPVAVAEERPPPAMAPALQPVKPPPPRHKPVTPRAADPPPPTPAPPAPQPAPAAPQLVQAAPAETPAAAAPGHGNAQGAANGVGTGAAGAGHGAIGDGPIEGPGDDYLDRLRRWLSRYKRYPEAAQQRKEEGGLVVSFTILHDGTVLDPQIERSSGFPLLDGAALQMLRDASPVPPLPPSFRGERVSIDLPVDFKIGLFERLF
jgi:periplasmic protein TonB